MFILVRLLQFLKAASTILVGSVNVYLTVCSPVVLKVYALTTDGCATPSISIALKPLVYLL